MTPEQKVTITGIVYVALALLIGGLAGWYV